jgi:hypothetical protein
MDDYINKNDDMNIINLTTNIFAKNNYISLSKKTILNYELKIDNDIYNFFQIDKIDNTSFNHIFNNKDKNIIIKEISNYNFDIIDTCNNDNQLFTALSTYNLIISKFTRYILYYLSINDINTAIDIMKKFIKKYLTIFKNNQKKNICGGWSNQGFSFNNYFYNITKIFIYLRDNRKISTFDIKEIESYLIPHYEYSYIECIEKMNINNDNLGNCTNANLYERFKGYYILSVLTGNKKYYDQILKWILDDMIGKSLKPKLGLQKDLSYHHHENQLYSGHYVNSYTSFILFFIKNVPNDYYKNIIFLKLLFLSKLLSYFKTHHINIYSFIDNFLIIDLHTNGRFLNKPFSVYRNLEPFINSFFKEKLLINFNEHLTNKIFPQSIYLSNDSLYLRSTNDNFSVSLKLCNYENTTTESSTSQGGKYNYYIGLGSLFIYTNSNNYRLLKKNNYRLIEYNNLQDYSFNFNKSILNKIKKITYNHNLKVKELDNHFIFNDRNFSYFHIPGTTTLINEQKHPYDNKYIPEFMPWGYYTLNKGANLLKHKNYAFAYLDFQYNSVELLHNYAKSGRGGMSEMDQR